MNYYRVLADNAHFSDRWFLSEPLTECGEEIDAREFCYGQHYAGPQPAIVPIGQRGQQVGFNFGAFDMPVLSAKVLSILADICPHDIQRFPVTVGKDIRGFEIVNALHQVKCVDEVRSNVRKWEPEDHRPDLIGQYLEFDPLVIDSRLALGHHFFRIWGSLVELIVSDDLKEAMEDLADLGITYSLVSE